MHLILRILKFGIPNSFGYFHLERFLETPLFKSLEAVYDTRFILGIRLLGCNFLNKISRLNFDLCREKSDALIVHLNTFKFVN
jgi:hypothetical protein